MPILPNGLTVPDGVQVDGSYTLYGQTFKQQSNTQVNFITPSGYYAAVSYVFCSVTFRGTTSVGAVELRLTGAHGTISPTYMVITSPVLTVSTVPQGFQFVFSRNFESAYVSNQQILGPLPYIAIPPDTELRLTAFSTDPVISVGTSSYANIDLFPYTQSLSSETPGSSAMVAPNLLV